MIRRRFNCIALTVALAAAAPAHAVIVLDHEARNLTPPPAPLLAAWNLQGQFINFNGTPIAPDKFIIAHHITGGSGTFFYQGQAYNPIAVTDIAGTDLRVWTIDTAGGTHTFPTYAPIWNPAVDDSEVGKPMVVFGRGTARGAAIEAALDPGTVLTPGVGSRPLTLTGTSPASGPTPQLPGTLRGWGWGAGDGLASWGQNIVDGVVPDDTYGDLLSFSFSNDASTVANEAALSGGDSSGGVFIFSNGQWKLAGVNLGADGQWSTTAAGPYFQGSMFDARGLYVGTATNHQYLPYGEGAIAGSSYSTRVGAHYAAIQALIGGTASGLGGTLVPEPISGAMITALVAIAARRNRVKR